MDVRQYADLFLSESRDHLTAYNHLLLEWEKDPAARETVGGLFRAMHTVKGMAATMGFASVADLAHRIENLLDALRKAEREPTPALLELLFKAGDALERAIGTAVGGGEPQVPGAMLEDLDRAATALGGTSTAERVSRSSLLAPLPVPVSPVGAGRQVRVSLRSDAPIKGARAVLVLKRAEALGIVSGVVPAVTAFEAEQFDGRFAFRLESAEDPARIEEALRGSGDVEAVEIAAEEPHEAPALEPSAGRGRHVRVDLRRLDALMNEIGELAIARGRLATLVAKRDDPELGDATVQIGRLASSLQSEIVAARMTPVWQVFDRFPRMVRDLARQQGKQVDFRVEGKEIELDRAILDEIAEPLVHLLRNAVDHGIEPPAERESKGKPAQGRLTLAALKERATVAIRVSDDGRGISRSVVLAKAKEMGLVAAEVEALPDEELFRLLGRSGLSTAKQVTEISGRGVGIDVVSVTVRALGGSLEIRSEEGKGATFTLRLPVTLAIMRALLARVGTETYAMPLTHVAEMVDPRPEDISRVQGSEAIMLRGRLVPLVRLRAMMGLGDSAAQKRVPVIVLEVGERRAGVAVDALLGQQEIVVKTFDPPRGMLPVFSGATILGDGRPALILDAGGLV